MSDISASEPVATPAEAPSAPPAEAFDLDSAVEDFATNAPDEWKSKAGKIQSELKNLRGKYTPYRDVFDGLHEGDRDAVFNLVNAIKSGNTDAAAEWMFEAAKGLTGDQFEAKFGLTKAEAAEAVADAQEEAAHEPEKELSVAEQVEKILAEREAAAKEKADGERRQNAINAKFSELGLSVERDENGYLTDFKSQMVAQMAIRHQGDIDKGFDEFNKWMGDASKSFLQAHAGDESLSPGQGVAAEADNAEFEKLTPKQKAKARLLRSLSGPEA